MAVLVGSMKDSFGLLENPETYSLTGFPVGSRVKLRLRNEEFMQAVVRTNNSTQLWYVNVDRESRTISPFLQAQSNIYNRQLPVPRPNKRIKVIGDLQQISN
jgi:hypothetical protein